MRALAAALALLCFFQEAALADAFKLRDGQTKRGKVLAEDDEKILLDPGLKRPVIEILKKDIAIADREPAEGGAKLGGVSFYSTPPNRKKRKRPEPPTGPFVPVSVQQQSQSVSSSPAEGEAVPQSPTYEFVEKLFEKQLEKNPKLKEWLERAAEQAMSQSADLDKMVQSVQ